MFFSTHFTLWKILNSMVMFGTVIMLCKYVFGKLQPKNLIMVCSIFCLIPLTVMGETGWVATTLNYQWPAAFSLLAFYPFFQLLKEKNLNTKIYWVALPFLLFLANQEQINLCFFTLTSIVSVYLWLKGKYDFRLLVYSIISFLGILFFLTTPGNSIRAVHEVNKWFPQYKDFSLIHKLDLGISSFGKPFFLDTNILFLLLFALIFVLTYFKCQNYYVKLLTALPIFLNLIIYFGRTMITGFTNVRGNGRSMIWNSSNLEKLFTNTGTKLSVHFPGTWIATLLVLGLLVCLLLGIYLSFNNSKTAVFLMLLMLMGFFSRVVMGFSPTVWASGMRTYYILYVVAALIVLAALKEAMNYLNPKKIELLQLGISMLGICTIILTVLNK